MAERLKVDLKLELGGRVEPIKGYRCSRPGKLLPRGWTVGEAAAIATGCVASPARGRFDEALGEALDQHTEGLQFDEAAHCFLIRNSVLLIRCFLCPLEAP